MDRNLGATKVYNAPPATDDPAADQSFGLYYQWGRKDPLPRVVGSTFSQTNPNTAPATVPLYDPNGIELGEGVKDDEAAQGFKKVSVATALAGQVNGLPYATKNPLTFIYNGVTPWDWYTDAAVNQNNTLWGGGGLKGAYDPCPKGWRVPPAGTWDDFGTNPYADPFWYYINGTIQTADGQPPIKYYATNGRLYKPSVGDVEAWYTGTGFRYHASGAAASYGLGYIWSHTTSETGALILWFTHKVLVPDNLDRRSGGLQVRCIQYIE